MDERPWLKHYEPGLPHTLRPYPECTLLDVMSDTVRQRPDHTALIFKGTRMSYAQLEQLTNAFAAALVAQGVKKGDRVALLLPNTPQSHHRPTGRMEGGRDRRPHQLALHAARAGGCAERGRRGNGRRPDPLL